jgi:NADPH-dependent 2,4-dienoyl-CoA reductase/sulfur reductase-like enzyme
MMFKLLLFAFLVSCVLAASDESSESNEKSSSLGNKNVKVAIVGGGFAGLAAFNRLHSAGLKNVDLFEASDRLGGRVYPVPFG